MLPFSLASDQWQFREATGRGAWQSAVVPGCVHLDLRRAKRIPDPFWGTNEADLQWIEERDWEYRLRFVPPPELFAEEYIELVADGLDTLAVVTLNGREIGRTENMFVGHRWDVRPHLRKGRNELVVRFASAMQHIRSHRLDHTPREINDPVGGCTRLRKEQCQFGWDWGPRLVTAGIWRDLRLEAWSLNRVENIRVTQRHDADGRVTLTLAPEMARVAAGLTCQWSLAFGGVPVAEGRGTEILVEHPQLWWPNGHGAQPLYDLHVVVQNRAGATLGEWTRRIGLRTIVLERRPDAWGESFQFVVNGRALFAKGANWIPAHSFVVGLRREDYARDLRAAVSAHMNMIRVWGGGIYESEDFYDLCDELGLLVWQDFMFACTLYPGDAAFLASVRTEADQQVRRLRHRACLALWCGNNEIESLNLEALKDPRIRGHYDAIFRDALPAAVAQWDNVTPYWEASPFRGDSDHSHAAGEKRGDTHYWDVWHARHPVEDYTRWKFRFVSEFGMQSFSSPATQATFCPADDTNVFGPTMSRHQKNRLGNQIILDYVSQYYRFPRGQEALVYLSQLNQARCMQMGVEHWRRQMPRSMGALYWQLNDCWPVASWSSIEFTGRWKALHFVARRFFAPALVSAELEGTETVGISNLRHSTVNRVHLHVTYDGVREKRGVLRWDVFHLDGQVLAHGTAKVAVAYGLSERRHTLDLTRLIVRHGRESLFVRIGLDLEGERVSEDTVFLTAPRFMALPRVHTKAEVGAIGRGEYRLTFTSPGFQHRFAFDLAGLTYEASDNYFDLYPREAKTVTVRLPQAVPVARLRKALRFQSLVDSYA